MTVPKFLIRSDEDYHEFNLSYCGRLIKRFKTSHFRKNSKHSAKIYSKVFFPPDCPEKFWMYYLVFEVNGKLFEVNSITKEAFDTLTRGIKPSSFSFVEFYTIDKHELIKDCDHYFARKSDGGLMPCEFCGFEKK
jgi:hypothetical protein